MDHILVLLNTVISFFLAEPIHRIAHSESWTGNLTFVSVAVGLLSAGLICSRFFDYWKARNFYLTKSKRQNTSSKQISLRRPPSEEYLNLIRELYDVPLLSKDKSWCVNWIREASTHQARKLLEDSSFLQARELVHMLPPDIQQNLVCKLDLRAPIFRNKLHKGGL